MFTLGSEWFEPESAHLERKASFDAYDKYGEAICAFANDLDGSGQGGVLLVGVHDETMQPTGSAPKDFDRWQQTVSGLRDAFSPVISFDIEGPFDTGQGWVARIVVPPSAAPPVLLKGRAHVRVGATTRIADQADMQRLVERRTALWSRPDELRMLDGAMLGDLDVTHFETLFAIDNDRSTAEKLAALKFIGPDYKTPTIVGMLVLGRDPESWIPGAYIQYLAFATVDGVEPINAKRLGGNVAQMIERTEDLLDLAIPTSVQFVQSSIEQRIPELPLAAVRQLVRNAVMHRSYFGTNAPVRIANYPDRLEMISPGGPYGIVKRHNFGEPYATDYRNPTLASALRELGFVQKFGAGLSIARQEMSKLGLPPPEFQVDDSFVRATLWKGRTAP